LLWAAFATVNIISHCKR